MYRRFGVKHIFYAVFAAFTTETVVILLRKTNPNFLRKEAFVVTKAMVRMMKSVLLIGMGKFGQTVGDMLLSMGDEVMIVDRKEEVINALANKYTNALIASCTNAEVLRSLDVSSFDACVVTVGDDFQSSLEITSLLKDLGARLVISRATTEIQKKFLLRNGADEVIYPDMDIAEKLAIKINSHKVHDYLELSDDYAVFELDVPREWKGSDILSINPRKRFDINILLIKKDDGRVELPSAKYVFEEGDHMMVFGGVKSTLAFTNRRRFK